MTRKMAGLLSAAPDAAAGGGAEGGDIRSLFRAAVAEHSKGAEAGNQSDTDDTEEADEGEDAEAEEAETGETTEETEESETAETQTNELISDKEYTELEAKHKDDPVALRKALQGAFTKKTQALAAQRKSLERLQEYQGFIDRLEEDPEGTIREFAKINNLTLAEAKAAVEGTTDVEATDTIEEALTDFRKDLGPDLEYLADSLAPAMRKLLERVTAATVDKSVKPLREQTNGLVARVADETTQSVLKAFETKHADWKQHEDAMVSLMTKVQPKGMGELEYLDMLYNLVTRDAWEKDKDAQIEKAASERVKKRVAKMNEGRSGETTRGTPESQVKKRPVGLPTFAEAAAAAKRGERFDDED